MKKIIQCTYCKNRSTDTPSCAFYNVIGGVAHGCGVCKAIADGSKSYYTV